MLKLLTRGASSPKLVKQGEGIEAVILHLASGKRVCPWSTCGCRDGCLVKAGRGQMTCVQLARQRRTDEFFDDRLDFLTRLDRELGNLGKRAARKGFLPVARLNGTSDIPWETFKVDGESLMMRHLDTTFYDYTKSEGRALQYVDGYWHSNYSLTLSRSEVWEDGKVRAMCDHMVNVAVVFERDLPLEFEGVRVIDGRTSDWRFRDPRGVVVGLSALGPAKHDTSGFVVRGAA